MTVYDIVYIDSSEYHDIYLRVFGNKEKAIDTFVKKFNSLSLEYGTFEEEYDLKSLPHGNAWAWFGYDKRLYMRRIELD